MDVFGSKLVEALSVYHASWLLGLSATVAVAIAIKMSSNQKSRSPLHRKFSFTSVGMAIGIFPESVKAPTTIINAAIYFSTCPAEKDLIELAVKPMLAFTRLSTIPVPETADCRPSTRSFAPSELIRKVEISGKCIKSTNDVIFKHLQESLSTGRDDLPWWEFLVVENVGEGESAVVLRMHHALADGISLVHVFEKFITYEDGSPVLSIILSNMAQKSKVEKTHKTNPFRLAWMLVRDATKVLTLGLSRSDDPTIFTEPNQTYVHSQHRECVVFPTVSLAFVKRLKTAANVTVNDILMTAVSQAVHEYCRAESCSVLMGKGASLQSRALLPIALPRSASDLEHPSTALRNKWCLVSANMSIGCVDLVDRLNSIHQTTVHLKGSPIAMVQLSLQNKLASRLPKIVARQTMLDIFRRHSLVFSNVPGPDRPCQLAGQTATGVQMFYSNLIPQVGLLSYAGNIYGNIVLDTGALPNAEFLAGHYAKALVDMATLLNVDKIPTNLQSYF
jgi:hypothetical protein